MFWGFLLGQMWFALPSPSHLKQESSSALNIPSPEFTILMQKASTESALSWHANTIATCFRYFWKKYLIINRGSKWYFIYDVL